MSSMKNKLLIIFKNVIDQDPFPFGEKILQTHCTYCGKILPTISPEYPHLGSALPDQMSFGIHLITLSTSMRLSLKEHVKFKQLSIQHNPLNFLTYWQEQ